MEKLNNEVSILPQIDKACGLDIHKDKIVCFISDKEGEQQHCEEFATYTCDLHKLVACIKSHGVSHCLMESTGIYWISLYHLLRESGLEVVVANPQHIKQIPKRKTDRKDARWLCTLMLHGLVRNSFIPDATQNELRDYCRQRLLYQQQQTRILNRVAKILETNNIKLKSVLTSLHTKTGIAIIRLLAQGETNIDKLLECLRARSRSKKEQFRLALDGTLDHHHRYMMCMLTAEFDLQQQHIDMLSAAIEAIIEQHYATVALCLDTITGIAAQSAQIIISEIGDNMDRFPTADHLTAWCGLAPGNNESAGKRRNTAIKKGNKYLRVALVGIAWAAVRTKNTYWGALFEKLRKRMKPKKTLVAIARRLLKLIHKTIKTKQVYTEKGVTHFLELQQKNKKQALLS